MKKTFYFYLILLLTASTFMISCHKMPLQEEDIKFSDSILFSKNPNGHHELYRFSDGVEERLISDINYDYWWSKVHPDQQKLLVYRSTTNPAKDHDDYENAELCIADINGENIEVIIPKKGNGWKAHGTARWNHDGTAIIMIAEINIGNSYQWRMIRTDEKGQNPKVLSHYWALDASFSPDGKKVLFAGFKENKLNFDLTNLEIMQGDYDAARDTVINIVSLTNNNSRDHDPKYSPDGRSIIFSGGNRMYTNVDLKIYDSVLQVEKIIHDDSKANGGSMSWSTDGQKIVFHSLGVLSHPFQIKVFNINNNKLSTLLYDPRKKYGYIHPEVY